MLELLGEIVMKKKLSESIADRYMQLSGLVLIDEAKDDEQEETEDEAIEAFDGGENLVNPIDHAEVVGGDPVRGQESSDLFTGEVSQISESKIRDIIKKVQIILRSRSSR